MMGIPYPKATLGKGEPPGGPDRRRFVAQENGEKRNAFSIKLK